MISNYKDPPKDDDKTLFLQQMKEKGFRLKKLREMTKLTRPAFEDKYQISRHTLRAWEEGMRAGLEDNVRNLIEIFSKEGIQCSVGWLLSGLGSPPKLFNQAESQQDEFIIPQTKQFVEDSELSAEINYYYSLYPNALHLQLQDESMEPFYSAGNYVGGVCCRNEFIHKLVGHRCIVETFMGEKYCRILQQGSKPGLYHLVSTNQQIFYPIITDVDLMNVAIVARIWIKNFKY